MSDYISGTFFSGMAGCNNDVTVFRGSTIPVKISTGEYPRRFEYRINGNTRNKLYLLFDGIYPQALLFLHNITNPSTDDKSYFASRQEARRKEIERAFGVLQSKFHIVKLPSCLWSTSKMDVTLRCCVIIHNMTMNERRPLNGDIEDYTGNVHVGAEFEFCFERKDWGSVSQFRKIGGSIAAFSGFSQYFLNAYAYMRSRRLVMQHVINNR